MKGNRLIIITFFAIIVPTGLGAIPVLYQHGGSQPHLADNEESALAYRGVSVSFSEMREAPVPGLPSILSSSYVESLISGYESNHDYVLFIPGIELYEKHRVFLLEVLNLLLKEGVVQFARTDIELDPDVLLASEQAIDMHLALADTKRTGFAKVGHEKTWKRCIDILVRPTDRIGFRRIPVRMVEYRVVPVAAKSIAAEERILDASISYEYRQVDYDLVDGAAGAAATLNSNSLSGYRARVRINRGTEISDEHLEPVLMTRVGEATDIVVNRNSLRVVFEGESMDQGYLGDVVRVRIPLVPRELRGIVHGPGKVYVELD